MKRLYFSMFALLVATPLIAQENAATQRLTEQSKQFDEQVIKVAENVYTAVGFSVSNVSMIVGDDGVVIVDTGMTRDDADRIVAEFGKISDKPVKAIIFTHSHGDHTGGVTAFLGAERPQIWAHKNFGSEYHPLTTAGVTFQSVRAARQAGFKLPPEQRINNGVAPVRYPKSGGHAFAAGSESKPTHFLEGERKTLKIAGVELELVSSPGETNDQLFVWYPAGKALFAGDNFYRSFPNLYAIRGTPNRSVRFVPKASASWPTTMRLPWSVGTPNRFSEQTKLSKSSAITAMLFSSFTAKPLRE